MLRTATIFVFGLLFVTACLVSGSQSTTTDLFQGRVELSNNVTLKGEQYWQSQNGDQRAFAYYGYRYGKAERFEHSVPNGDFAYLEDPNHPKLGHTCPQIPLEIPSLNFFSRNLSQSEDCLYLDVYLPPIKKDQEARWPVLFWIHGGAFKFGDKDLYNASILASAVDAIVVTVNYRVSAFGFFSSGDEAAAGNWAIGDLKLALNWTFANIASFNGDSGKITILGESAGGALTSALMLDDQVRGKVFAAVAMSGSILRPWAINRDPVQVMQRLASVLACPNATSTASVQCLKSLSVEQILNGTATIEKEMLVMLYTPVIDGKHIPQEPYQILKNRANEPASKTVGTFITGYLADDAGFFLFTQPELLNATFNLKIVSQLLSGVVLMARTKPCMKNIQTEVKLILEKYNVSATNSPQELRQKYYTIATDVMFGVGAMEESILYSNTSANKNQMYIISFDSGFHNLGAFHFLEIIHLFRGKLDVFLKDNISDPLTKSLHQYFRQIAHDGRSSGPSFSSDGNLQELNNQAEWINKKQDFAATINFWKDLESQSCAA